MSEGAGRKHPGNAFSVDILNWYNSDVCYGFSKRVSNMPTQFRYLRPYYSRKRIRTVPGLASYRGTPQLCGGSHDQVVRLTLLPESETGRYSVTHSPPRRNIILPVTHIISVVISGRERHLYIPTITVKQLVHTGLHFDKLLVFCLSFLTGLDRITRNTIIAIGRF